MFSTIKTKMIVFIALVMVTTTLVNIYFTDRDVGNAMMRAQEKSARNILHFMEINIQGSYSDLLSDKITTNIEKKKQLENAADIINTVLNNFYFFAEKKYVSKQVLFSKVRDWLGTKPFENLNCHIFNENSIVIASTRKNLMGVSLSELKDTKHRDISKVMRYDNIGEKGDCAVFNLKDNTTGTFVKKLAYFIPNDDWKCTVVTAIDIDYIEEEAKKKLKKIIKSLSESSKELHISKNGFVYMFDENESILIPVPDHIGITLSGSVNQLTGNPIHEDIKKAAITEAPELRYTPSEGDDPDPMIIYTHYFKSLKWYISVVVPVNEINKPAKQLLIKQNGIIILMFLAGLLAVYILVTRIASPINLLASYAKELPEQDFTAPEMEKSPIDDLPGKYKDEVGRLANAFIIMKKELRENILNLVKVTAARERFQGELNIARDIQLGIIPKTFPCFPEFNEFDLYATLIPAKEVGGDLYDFFRIDEDHICFTLGDVSDKGIPAALFMVITRTLIKTSSEKACSPADIMVRVNNVLSTDNPRSMFVTLIIGIMNIKTGIIRYSNGGHNPPVLIRSSEHALFKKEISGPVIGAMPDIPYKEFSFTLNPGESLFLYTDGVTEALNTSDELFSNERLLEIIETNRNTPVKSMVENVLANVHDHTGSAPQSDDIAMLAIKYNG